MRLPARNVPGRPVLLRSDLMDGLKYAWRNPTIKGTATSGSRFSLLDAALRNAYARFCAGHAT